MKVNGKPQNIILEHIELHACFWTLRQWERLFGKAAYCLDKALGPSGYNCHTKV